MSWCHITTTVKYENLWNITHIIKLEVLHNFILWYSSIWGVYGTMRPMASEEKEYSLV